MRRRSLLFGWWYGWSTSFCLGGRLLDPPSPLFFFLLSSSRLRTRMSRNSALESPGLC